MDHVIEALGAAEVDAALADLSALLHDAVDDGASVGFLPPLAATEADAYWRSVALAVAGGDRVLLVARGVDGRIVGAVQLDQAWQANGRHRAEVAKLLVHRTARRQGVARALMKGVEEIAQARGRTLLVLDTRQGDPAERLYQSLGYQYAGTIPDYAHGADGALHPTVIYYRRLDA